MSVSALFGTRLVAPPQAPTTTTTTTKPTPSSLHFATPLIECSSRPQKKATAHHKKTRPRKTQKWDIRRGPCVYAPLPTLPPEWTLVTEETSPPPPLQQDQS